MMPLSGVLEIKNRLSVEAAARLKAQWKKHVEEILAGKTSVILLEEGIKFVPHATPDIPDAICRYCLLVNLHSSIWCAGCGAPLVHAP